LRRGKGLPNPHLSLAVADPVAYRRDRRKDRLLQESGYFVLRFLAEDVGRELDLVLDAILRALAHRQTMLSPSKPLHFMPEGGRQMALDVTNVVESLGRKG
jgi:hypothetical protein